MRLFKIKNKGWRYLMGAIALLVTIGVVLAVLGAIGYGIALLDEKCLGWSFFSNNSGITVLVFFPMMGALTICMVVILGFAVAGIILGSKTLGNKLFNNVR